MCRNTSKPVKIKMGSVEAVLDASTRKTKKIQQAKKSKSKNIKLKLMILKGVTTICITLV